MRAFLIALALFAALGGRVDAQPAIDVALDRTATYIDHFIARFANVVAEERYVQEATRAITSLSQLGRGPMPSRSDRVVLRSDFLLVRLPGFADWLPFRDVYEVNGSAVHDREGRLAKLFMGHSGSALEQAQQITTESARYNIGDLTRTINNPVIALAFLARDVQSRFDFTWGKPDSALGPNVYALTYAERERPTLIRGLKDSDLPARGQAWIDVTTGQVVKTEFALSDVLITAKITTTFKRDDALGVGVPQEMAEDYRLTSGSHVTGKATYSRFRQFSVNTDEAIGKPEPPRE